MAGTSFIMERRNSGIHTNNLHELTLFQKQTFKADTVSDLYPEYYILKVNGFNQVARSPLEEWIYYLNTEKYLPLLQPRSWRGP
ncbi:hypothetical protein JCM17136A_03350 [Phocaeicola sartorii JCM 17136 = DSM 21941]